MPDRKTKTGTLYLCATPIGNLSDVTYRVVETLGQADLIAAEDTRNSRKLLSHFDIHTPLTSYHEYNRVEKARTLLQKLQEGLDVALISDAGTPLISDPGAVLVKMCQDAGIRVTSMPGPCACITALTLSGMDSTRFVFEGFLPPKEDKKAREKALDRLRNETRTILIYAAPHDVRQDMADLYRSLGEREVALCRELTKKFEEVERTLLSRPPKAPRGEYVLVVAGADEEQLALQKRDAWDGLTVAEHVRLYEEQGLERMEALKQVAKDLGKGKRDIYRELLKEEEN